MASRKPSATQLREREVLRLYAKGLTLQQIADRVGYASRASALKAYRRAIAATGAPDLSQQDHHSLELIRLEKLIGVTWQAACRGDLTANARYERLVKVKAALLGMNLTPSMWGGEVDDPATPRGDAAVVSEDQVAEFRRRRLNAGA